MLGGAVCDSTNHTLGVVQVLNKEGAGGGRHETGGWPVFDENDEVRRRAEYLSRREKHRAEKKNRADKRRGTAQNRVE
jgi:hypothetical protein